MKNNREKREAKTICPLDCPDTCGMIATIEHGRVVSLRGDPDHPVTRGFICRKMRANPERLYAANRILTPMRRIGRKGEGRFVPLSWDQALEILADRITEIRRLHGGEAVLPYNYAGNMGIVNRNAGYAFFHKIGASRLQETICSAAGRAGECCCSRRLFPETAVCCGSRSWRKNRPG